MQIKLALIALITSTPCVTAQDAPLSAIDWLAVQRSAPTEVLTLPPVEETPTAQSAAVPEVDVLPLDAPVIGGVGLLPSSMTGLPTTLWQNSSEEDVVAAIEALQSRKATVPALDALFHTLLLAEAAPPNGSDGLNLLQTRVAVLQERGLVSPAEALLERAGDLSPDLFAQAFDLALLTGSDEALCQALNAAPSLSNDLATRIWCATRDGDFSRAVTIFQTATALDQLSDLDEELLLRFLDPEYAETASPLRNPVRPTPLQFRLFEAVGEALPTTPLPLPFAVVELNGDAGWRAQISAAERLARAGTLDGNQLLGIYTLQQPAASGGVWDRVAAFQQFEGALAAGNAADISNTLERVWPQMRVAGLLVPFSELFAAQLADVPLTGRAKTYARYAGVLSSRYETTAVSLAETDDAAMQGLAQIAMGQSPNDASDTIPHLPAFIEAWSQPPKADAPLVTLSRDGGLGIALLRTIALFDDGASGNDADLGEALQALRAFGLEDTARRAALQLAILKMEGALR